MAPAVLRDTVATHGYELRILGKAQLVIRADVQPVGCKTNRLVQEGNQIRRTVDWIVGKGRLISPGAGETSITGKKSESAGEWNAAIAAV